MNIGERIRAIRENTGLTLEELSEKIGISKQTLSRYETGAIKNIPISNIEALAEALNVPLSYLMGYGKDTPKNEKIANYITDTYLKIDREKQDFLLHIIESLSRDDDTDNTIEKELLTIFRKLNHFDQGKILGIAMSLLQHPSEPLEIEQNQEE